MTRTERLADLLRELARFGGVGLAATAIHAAVYLAALAVLAPQAANLAGYLSAVLVSYVGHGQVTFAQGAPRTGPWIGRMAKFSAVSLLGLGLNAGFVHLLVTVLDTAAWMAVLFIGSVTPGVTYILLKLWVFARP